MATRTARRKLKIDRSANYRAWQGASVDIDGLSHTVARGAVLRGDHPLVQRLGAEAFVDDGLPEDEWPSMFTDAIAVGEIQEAERAASHAVVDAGKPRISPDTPISQLMVCHMALLSSAAGSCGEGAVVLRTDRRVALAPQCFRPLADTLVVA